MSSYVSNTFVNEQLNGVKKRTCACDEKASPFPDVNTQQKIKAGIDVPIANNGPAIICDTKSGAFLNEVNEKPTRTANNKAKMIIDTKIGSSDSVTIGGTELSILNVILFFMRKEYYI